MRISETFEKFKPSDFADCAGIIRANWNYRKYNRSSENCRIFSELDLSFCLSESNYTDLCYLDKKLAGFLFAHIPGDGAPFKDYKKNRQILLEQLTGEEGKLFKDYSNLYERVNDHLIKNSGIKDSSEIVLFALDPAYTRRGIGSHLLERYLKTLREKQIKRSHLFTDTTCDFPFYLSRGYTEEKREIHQASLRNNESITFFLYSLRI